MSVSETEPEVDMSESAPPGKTSGKKKSERLSQSEQQKASERKSASGKKQSQYTEHSEG